MTTRNLLAIKSQIAPQNEFKVVDTDGNITVNLGSDLVDTNVRSDLASTTDAAKGAALVGYKHPGSGASARTLYAKAQESLSVTDFGAVGDGITDDAATIQNCIVSLARFGRFVIPPGTYALSAPIDLREVSTKIEIDAYGATFIPTVDGVSSAFIFGGDTGVKAGMGRGWSLKGAIIKDNSSGGKFIDGLYLNKTHDYVISHNNIHKVSRHGIYVKDSWRGEIVNWNNIESCGDSGIFLEGAGESPQIINNSIRVNAYAAILIQKAEGLLVLGNDLESNPFGIKLWEASPLAGAGPVIAGMVVEGNYFENHSSFAIDLFSKGTDGVPKISNSVKISTNYFHTSLGFNAIRLYAGVAEVIGNGDSAKVQVVETGYRKAHVLDTRFKHVDEAGTTVLPTKNTHIRLVRTHTINVPSSGSSTETDFYNDYVLRDFEIMPSPALYSGAQVASMKTYSVKDVWRRDIAIVDNTKGLILRSPNGNFWRIKVDDAGALSTESVATSAVGEQFNGLYDS